MASLEGVLNAIVSNSAAFWSSIKDESEFWAGIFGALIGGLFVIVGQKLEAREARRQREGDRLSEQQATGYSLLFKIMKIHGMLVGLHNHFSSLFEGDPPRASLGEPWTFYLPLANPPEPISFAAEEMSLLLQLQEADIFNGLLELELRYNTIVTGIVSLNQERRELTDRLVNEGFDGDRATGVLTPTLYRELRPRMINVDNLFEDLKGLLFGIRAPADKLIADLFEVLRQRLHLAHRMTFENVPPGSQPGTAAPSQS